MLSAGTIDAQDLNRLVICDSPEQAVDRIVRVIGNGGLASVHGRGP
jgi:hypothetical protein